MTKKLYVLMLIIAGFYHNSLAQNLLDMQNWKIGTGATGAFALNGTTAENQRIWGIGPHGERVILWKAKPDGDVLSDGGFNHDYFAVDHTSTYRFMIWLKKTNSSNGISYLGTNNVNNLDGTANVNPYFWIGDLPELNKWYLIVAYVHGSGDNSTTSYGGIYDSVTGKKVDITVDFKFDVSTTHANMRAYLYYDPDVNDEQYFYAPKVEKVNGNEQPISSILNGEAIQTEIRNDAGLRGDAGARSGFFETNSPVNYPVGASSWWHILDVRHSNLSNNYAMQFSGSFFDQDLYFRKTNENAAQAWSRVLLEVNGKVGIGTTTPQAKLQIVGNSTTFPELSLDHYQSNMGASTLAFKRSRGTEATPLPILDQDYIISVEGWSYVGSGFKRSSYIASQANGIITSLGTPTDLIFATSSGGSDANEGMRLDKNGNLGIGTTTPTEKLSVNGKIRAKEIKVEPNPATWPDYVFEEDYKIGTLEELEHYVKANKHLPEMPTVKEVAVNGVELGEMNRLLLKKVEELTLHLIEKDKEVQKLNVNFQELSKELLTIKDLLLKKK